MRSNAPVRQFPARSGPRRRPGWRIACTLLLLGAVGGCASTVPEPTLYLLRSDAGPATRAPDFEPGVIIAVGRVTVAPYLDQPGIVVATTGHRMQIANDHRWAEPLDVAVRRNLEVGIAAASGLSVVGAPMAREQRLIVDVTIQQLHGTIDGQVSLVAEWQWLDGGSAALISHHQSSDHTEVEQDGYDALVDAHAMLLERLAGSVAATLPPIERALM